MCASNTQQHPSQLLSRQMHVAARLALLLSVFRLIIRILNFSVRVPLDSLIRGVFGLVLRVTRAVRATRDSRVYKGSAKEPYDFSILPTYTSHMHVHRKNQRI